MDEFEIIKKKKKRKPNFTDEETLTLLTAVADRKRILLGKHNQSVKNNSWRQVTNLVNCVSDYERELREIKKKFVDLRCIVRQKAATDGDPGIPVKYSVVEKAMLPMLENIDNHELEGISDSEDVDTTETNEPNEMMVLIEGESVSIYDPSSLTETATTPSSDISSDQGNKKELSLTDDPLEQTVVDNATINSVEKTKKNNKYFFKAKNNPTTSGSDNLSKQARKRTITSTDDDSLERVVVDYIPKNPDLDFFRSILPDMADLNTSQKRRFKQKVLQLLDDMCNDGIS